MITVLTTLIWLTTSVILPNNEAKTIKYFSDVRPGGNYEYGYETDNGIYLEEKGTGHSPNSEDHGLSVKGSFLYTSPEGLPIHLTYTADENGFHPEGDHLPTPPPIPPQILKALVWIANQKQKQQEVEQQDNIKEPFFDNVNNLYVYKY